MKSRKTWLLFVLVVLAPWASAFGSVQFFMVEKGQTPVPQDIDIYVKRERQFCVEFYFRPTSSNNIGAVQVTTLGVSGGDSGSVNVICSSRETNESHPAYPAWSSNSFGGGCPPGVVILQAGNPCPTTAANANHYIGEACYDVPSLACGEFELAFNASDAFTLANNCSNNPETISFRRKATIHVADHDLPSFNIDFGGGGPGEFPFSNFSGASSQDGTWHPISSLVSLVRFFLFDTLTTPSCADGLPLTTNTSISFNSPDTPDSIGRMMDDGLDVGSGVFLSVLGIPPRNYTVYTYAWAPFGPSTLTEIDVLGANEPPQTVGGYWPRGFVQGITHAVHTIATDNGVISVTAEFVSGFTSFLNGIQIIPGLPCNRDCDCYLDEIAAGFSPDACDYQYCEDGRCLTCTRKYGNTCPSFSNFVGTDDILCAVEGFGNYCACPNADFWDTGGFGCGAPNNDAACKGPSGSPIDTGDILAVVEAFGGADPFTCPTPSGSNACDAVNPSGAGGCGPAASSSDADEIRSGLRASLESRSISPPQDTLARFVVAPRSRTVRAGETLDVDIYLSGSFGLVGYQIGLTADRVTSSRAESGALVIEDVTVDTDRKDYAFRDLYGFPAVDTELGRVGGVMIGSGVDVGADERVYIGTFTVRAADDALGTYAIRAATEHIELWAVGHSPIPVDVIDDAFVIVTQQ